MPQLNNLFDSSPLLSSISEMILEIIRTTPAYFSSTLIMGTLCNVLSPVTVKIGYIGPTVHMTKLTKFRKLKHIFHGILVFPV